MSKIENLWNSISTFEGEARCEPLEELSEALWNKGEREASIAVLNELRDLLLGLGRIDSWLDKSWWVALRYKNIGDVDFALEVLDESIDVSLEVMESENRPFLQELKAQCLASKGSLNDAEVLFGKAAAAFDEINEQAKAAECRMEVAKILFKSSLFHPSIAQAKHALEAFQRSGEAELAAHAHEVLGFCYKALEDFAKAKMHFQLALNLHRFLRNQVDEMRLKSMLGCLESIIGNAATAIELLKSVAAVRGNRDVNIEAAKAMLEISRHSFRHGDRVLAMNQEREANEILKALGA